MSETVVKVESLSKKFCRHLKRSMLYGAVDVGKSMMGIPCKTSQLRRDEFWALKNINFELRKGDSLGIIGVNGSGKSTLLRMLTGIFTPDEGRIEVRGRISSLIAVGAGFHPHMTGSENIYLNGIILGMTKKEIDEKYDDIVRFAEIGDFLEAPVATYSSGMTVRLGFSIAMFCNPDILLVDEVLSVGDQSFRNKSLRKMAEFRAKANALIFISHNMEQVRQLCNRLIIMDKGDLIYDGETMAGCELYEEMSRKKRLSVAENDKEDNRGLVSTFSQSLNTEVAIDNINVKQSDGKDEIGYLDSFTISCDFEVRKKVESFYFTFAVLDERLRGNIVRYVSNSSNGIELKEMRNGKYSLSLKLDDQNLAPGLYFVQIAVRNAFTNEDYERVMTEVPFCVTGTDRGSIMGMVEMPHKWELNSK